MSDASIILIACLFVGIGAVLWIVGKAMEGPPEVWRAVAKEKRIMDDVHEKQEQYETIVARIQKECPDQVGDLSLSIGYKTWIAMAIERFNTRQKGKNFAEQIKLLGLAKQYYTEYANALEAKDTLSRLIRGDFSKEKDEEAEIRELDRNKRKKVLHREIAEVDKDEDSEIRQLEREKKKLALQREIDALKNAPVAPKPTPSMDRRSRQEKLLADLDRIDQEERCSLAKCGGDERRQAEIRLIYDDERMRIKEGR